MMENGHINFIGFHIENDDDYQYWLRLALEQSEDIQTARGLYRVWRPGNGIELWMQYAEERGITSLNAHFSGASNVLLALEQRARGAELTEMEGSLLAWVNGWIDEEQRTGGDYPLLFDVPDDARLDVTDLPVLATGQLTVFAHQASIFPDYLMMQDSGALPIPMAEEALFPVGTFNAEPDKMEPAVVFTGSVVRAQQVMNPLTGEDFPWLQVKTFGATLDVILLPGKSAQVGNVVYIEGCVSGRLLDHPE